MCIPAIAGASARVLGYLTRGLRVASRAGPVPHPVGETPNPLLFDIQKTGGLAGVPPAGSCGAGLASHAVRTLPRQVDSGPIGQMADTAGSAIIRTMPNQPTLPPSELPVGMAIATPPSELDWRFSRIAAVPVKFARTSTGTRYQATQSTATTGRSARHWRHGAAIGGDRQ